LVRLFTEAVEALLDLDVLAAVWAEQTAARERLAERHDAIAAAVRRVVR
jgi:hypothetical protein